MIYYKSVNHSNMQAIITALGSNYILQAGSSLRSPPAQLHPIVLSGDVASYADMQIQFLSMDTGMTAE